MIVQCSLIESSSADQEAVGGPLEDPGNSCYPGVPGASRDGDGEADEVLRYGLGIRSRVEAPPGAIGETGRPPAFEGRRCCRRDAIGAGGGLGRESEEGPVLVPIEGAVEVVADGRRHSFSMRPPSTMRRRLGLDLRLQ